MDEIKEIIGLYIWIIGVILVVSGILWFATRSDQIVNNGIATYDEFQEIYNTTKKLNTDLGNMQTLPDSDVMFQQFSKAQRVNTIKTQLNKWVEDYNGKSKMWNKSMWKSKTLPYQLSVTDFSNYK